MLSSTLPLVNHLHPLPCSMTDWVNQVWLTTSVNVRVGGGRRGKALKQRGWKLFAYQRCVSWYHPTFLLEKGIAELIFPTCLTSKSTVRERHKVLGNTSSSNNSQLEPSTSLLTFTGFKPPTPSHWARAKQLLQHVRLGRSQEGETYKTKHSWQNVINMKSSPMVWFRGGQLAHWGKNKSDN